MILAEALALLATCENVAKLGTTIRMLGTLLENDGAEVVKWQKSCW